MNGLEPRQRRELEHTFHLALEEDRHDDQATRRSVTEARSDADVLRGKLVRRHDALLDRALADETFPEAEPVSGPFSGVPVGADAPKR